MKTASLLLLFALSGCGRGETPLASLETPEASGPPDILLVLVNGLRADLPGHPYAEAAVLEGLGLPPKQSFSAAYAQTVQPFTSLGSLLTGQYPSRIPLCSQPQTQEGAVEIWCSEVPEGQHTLPQVLSLYGYATVLALTPENEALGALGKHFDGTIQAGADGGLAQLQAPLTAWWEEQGDKPRLAIIVTSLLGPDLEQAAITQPGEGSESFAALWESYWQAAQREGSALAGLHTALAPELLVMSSGHGVSLGETTGTANVPKKNVFHDVILDRTIHVPLHIFGDLESAEATSHPVELVDLFPTLVELAEGVAVEGLPGASLLSPSVQPPSQERAYAEFGDMLAYRKGRHLLGVRVWMHGGTSLDPEVDRRLAAPEESRVHQTLHDVVSDGMQTTDLAAEQTELTAAMLEALQALRAESSEGLQLDWDQVQALKEAGALGYW